MFIILIIDPNDPFRRSLKKVLVNRFPLVDVQEAADGNEGLEIMETFHPDIIFLEIHLPAETALDLASRIKAEHPDIIIVILTSYDLPEYKTAVKQSGVEHMVPKDDWTGEDMIALVQSILSDLKMDEPKKYSPQNFNNVLFIRFSYRRISLLEARQPGMIDIFLAVTNRALVKPQRR